MLINAARSLLDRSGGREPSHDAWALVLVAAGVDPALAVTLPQRLGYVFHIGRYDEHAVITQLDAWAAALRVRAQPETADVVEAAARRLREEPWPLSGPQTPPAGGEPDTPPSPVSGSQPPRVGQHPDSRQAFPGAAAVPGGGGRTRSSRPRLVVLGVVIGLLLLGFCVAGVLAAVVSIGP